MTRRRGRILAVLVAAFVAAPAVATASPVDDVGRVTLMYPAIGNSGRHFVCYAPGFASWVICIDYP